MKELKKAILFGLIIVISISAFPEINDQPPDFTLYNYNTQDDWKLYDHLEEKVILFITGSGTQYCFTLFWQERETLYQKYKNNPKFLMFDVYTSEANPPNVIPLSYYALNMCIARYEAYKDSCWMTITGLIESIHNPWSDGYWGPSFSHTYSSCILIDFGGNICFTIPNIDRSEDYAEIEQQVANALTNTSISNKKKETKDHFSVTYAITGGKITVIIPQKWQHSIKLVTTQGRCVLSHKGFGKGEYSFNKPVASGVYILRVATDKQISIQPVLIK